MSDLFTNLPAFLLEEPSISMWERVMMQERRTTDPPPRPPKWLREYNENVDRLDRAIETVQEFGGKLLIGPYVPISVEQKAERHHFQQEFDRWLKDHPLPPISTQMTWEFSEDIEYPTEDE